MKRIRLRAPAGLSNLKLVDEERPVPRRGEVLVRIRACSLNYRDDFLVRGRPPVADGRIPLSDGAGEVAELGADVEELEVGDRVVSTFYPKWKSGEMSATDKRVVPGETIDGYASQYVCMPADFFLKAPAGLSHVESATLTCAGVTAWRGLVTCGHVKPGDTVLIQGTGSVSLFALQFAKAAGARVIATSSSDEKLAKLKALGADELINYVAVPSWGEKAKELTDGRGVDHVIEVGGATTLAESLAACATGAHIAMIGLLTGLMAEISIPAVFSNQIRISGISIGSRDDQQKMIRAISINRVKPVIDRIFPIDDTVAAFTHYAAQKHFGKVCIEL